MKVYQLDGLWFVETEGGSRNGERIPGQELGPFSARPEPVTKWRKGREDFSGSGDSIFTQFRALSPTGEEVFFTVEDFQWTPSFGYSWWEGWELFSEETPPALGEAYTWAGDHWEPIAHPMTIAAK